MRYSLEEGVGSGFRQVSRDTNRRREGRRYTFCEDGWCHDQCLWRQNQGQMHRAYIRFSRNGFGLTYVVFPLHSFLTSSNGLVISSIPLYRLLLDTASDQILKKATAIEASVLSDHAHEIGKDYKAKIRSLYLNLKDRNNPGLRENIMSGSLAITRFTKMTSQVWNN